MKVALRASNGLFVSSWDSPSTLIANRTSVGPGEIFEVILIGEPVPVPPPATEDQIDFSKVVITAQSPDVKNWPIGAKFTSLGLSSVNNATIDFTKMIGPNAWPPVTNMEGGEIQYTLWVGCFINGLWYFAACISCAFTPNGNYVPTGPTLQVGQLPNQWYYFTDAPLAEYQPKPGEQVAWVLTSGVQRRDDRHKIMERTQVVLTPFSEGVYSW